MMMRIVLDTNGLVVREAAACGLASVLIKDSCAAEGITDGRNGFVIDENADAMASLLITIGNDIAMLPSEEKRERVHKNKAVLEAERQAKDAVINAQAENQRLEGQKERIAGEVQNIKQQKERLESNISQLENYAAAFDIHLL